MSIFVHNKGIVPQPSLVKLGGEPPDARDAVGVAQVAAVAISDE